MQQTYDPSRYWNERENPNCSTESGIRELNRRFLNPRIRETESILELGPGIGRLMPLYQGRTVHTVDLSRKYSPQLRAAAKENKVTLTEAFINKPDDPLPFTDQSFGLGISFSVFLHIPVEHIRHSMKEMARVCKKTAVIVGADPEWKSKKQNHVFAHDYEALCEELGFQIVRKKRNGIVILFVYESNPQTQ